MFGVEPWILLMMNAGVIIGHFGFLYLHLTKEFTTRFKAFREAFDKWLDGETTALIHNLKKQLEMGQIEAMRNAMDDNAKKRNLLNKLTEEYNSVNVIAQTTLKLLALGVVSACLGFLYPNYSLFSSPGPDFSDISLGIVVLAILTIVYYLWKYLNLTNRVAKYELGTPISEFVQQELAKESQE
jgi:hypothetical protein